MGDLTKDFSVSEFSCKCGCGLKYPAPALFGTLQTIRDVLGKPIRIVSGWRCTKHNHDVGSHVLGKQGFVRGQCGDESASAHTRGEAADISVAGMAQTQLYDAVVQMHKDGLIPDLQYVYEINGSATNCHVAVDKKARKSPYGNGEV